jgi:hypothetical protein
MRLAAIGNKADAVSDLHGLGANLNNKDNIGRTPISTSPSSRAEFHKAIEEGAKKFEGKVLLEPQIAQITALSDPTSGGLAPEPIVVERTIDRISTRGLLMILKEMKKINLEAQEIKSFPAYYMILKDYFNLEGFSFYRAGNGTYSDQIYIVTVNRDKLSDKNSPNTFVIKSVQWASYNANKRVKSRHEPTPAKELQDLERVKQYVGPKMEKFSEEQRRSFPNLSLVEETYWYFNSEHERKYIAVMNIAEGDELFDFISDNLFEFSRNIDSAMYEVGKSLGSFHYNLASSEMQKKLQDPSFNDLSEFKTMVHGDLHTGNIFYTEEPNPGANPVTFIDLASLSDSIFDPQSVLRDLSGIYTHTKFRAIMLDSRLTGPSQMEMLNRGFESFAQGYVMGLPISDQSRFNIKKLILKNFKQLSITSLEYLQACYQHGNTLPVNNQKLPYEDPRLLVYFTLVEISRGVAASAQTNRLKAIMQDDTSRIRNIW